MAIIHQLKNTTIDLMRVGKKRLYQVAQEGVYASEGDLATLRQQVLTFDYAVRSEINALIKNMLKQRSFGWEKRMAALPPCTESLAPVAGHKDFETGLKELEKLAPHAFPIWNRLLQVCAKTMEGFPIHSVSVEGHTHAEMFRCFMTGYLDGGTVLDVGCGPQPVPSYLAGYPVDRLAGIDPIIASMQPHPFTFVQTVAEFLPWKDKTFNNIVIGTSLDHVLLLDVSLKEFRRVLKDDGMLLIWLGFIPGAKPYDPYSPDVGQIDDYHLFHFDKPWFEEMMKQDFILEECVEFSYPDPTRFYAYRVCT